MLDNTVHGQILERTVARDARVYVAGLLVAQEERFALSHNITSLTRTDGIYRQSEKYAPFFTI